MKAYILVGLLFAPIETEGAAVVLEPEPLEGAAVVLEPEPQLK